MKVTPYGIGTVAFSAAMLVLIAIALLALFDEMRLRNSIREACAQAEGFIVEQRRAPLCFSEEGRLIKLEVPK